MTVKSRVRARLESIQNLEGVFPTSSEHSAATRERWRSVARNLGEANMGEATHQAESLVREELPSVGAEGSALEMFSGSTEMRQQAAAFTRAGIGFFHGSQEYSRMPVAERRSRGGNGAVSRVMSERTRILLEPQRLIVSFARAVKAAERRRIFKRHKLEPIGNEGLPLNTYRAACYDGPALDIALALMDEKAVRYSEPDFIEAIGPRHTPADPLFAQQWHHKNIGCEAAWDVTRGQGINIAVIDNGFDTGHQDLAFGPLSGWFRETADLADADFVPGIASMPDGDHGTACAGMIAATENNAIGGCGVAHGSALSMIACLVDQIGTQTTLARAIAYAADPTLENVAGPAGADIIACSLGPNGANWTLRQVLSDAIDFATTKGRGGKGTAIFWACTNGNFPISADQVCSHPQVCAVGRSTSTDSDNGSGFGQELAFLAPGVQVLIPSSGNGYGATTGTSFAAPCAAGVAALALSQYPALKAKALRELLQEECDKVGPLAYIDGRNSRFGFGRINAKRAVDRARTLCAGA
jgi:thermitase